MTALPIDWVVFDLGETLIDETSHWASWADYLGVSRFAFFGLIGKAIADRRPHTDAFDVVRPGFNFPVERAAKIAAGFEWSMSNDDLYADAIPALVALREAGYRLAVMANQPAESQSFMDTLPVDRVATSSTWGVLKPDPAFFAKVAAIVGASPGRIAYVGDRIDNDVVPAKAAGMVAVHVRRGPWGWIQADWPEATQADITLDSLLDLPAQLAARS